MTKSKRTIELTIERMSFGPDAIARDSEGKTVFVSGGCPGDIVLAQVTEEKPRFARASIVTLIQPSPLRSTQYLAPLPGCPWAHIDYTEQLKQKENNVRANLERIGKFLPEQVSRLTKSIVPCSVPWGYRNKIELTPLPNADRFTLGMHIAQEDGSLALVETPESLLLPQKAKRLPGSINGALRYLQGKGNLGITRVGIRVSQKTGEIEIALWTPPGAFPRHAVAKVLQSATNATSIVRIMTKESPKTHRHKIKGVEVLYGKGFWEERLSHEQFMISAPSFFQVNTTAAEHLVDLSLEAIFSCNKDTALHVADLYCGAGTFTLPLARRGALVSGVEMEGSSIRDLKRNLENANLYAETIGGDAAREFPSFNNEVDAIMVDPPRSGLNRELVKSLRVSSANTLVYISCDSATLSRDLKLLVENNTWQLDSVQPIDLFPQTHHVECVTVLKKH